jgi:hypothetical protein
MHRQRQQFLQDAAQQKTNAYVDVAWFVSSEPGDDSLPSASLEWETFMTGTLLSGGYLDFVSCKG